MLKKGKVSVSYTKVCKLSYLDELGILKPWLTFLETVGWRA